jgi:coniferyl-aldehyde dehydrogenase
MSGDGPAAMAYSRLRAVDRRERGLGIDEREDLLKALQNGIVSRRETLVAALDADFGRRAREETLLTEVYCASKAAHFARKRLRRWARPQMVGVDKAFWPSGAWVVPQPLGVVGILSAWNYPVQLALSPLVGAIAAGNRVALKPSEKTPRSAGELSKLLEETLGPEVVQTVQGGPEVAMEFVRQPFDHILYTGATQRGREVMKAAADHLTPVTLELGGKCPVVVLPDADLASVSRAIVLGKMMNGGQTCIAPDTVLLVNVNPESFRDGLEAAYRAMFPAGPGTSIISDTQVRRIDALAQSCAAESLGPPSGGRNRALSIVMGPEACSPLLEDEIFGPVLPILPMPSIVEALRWIEERPAPLAVYLFTKDRRAEAAVLAGTRAGALVLNGTVIQAAIESLPFGGVRESGFGRYHGRAGFFTFSNSRSYLRVSRMSMARLLEPPFTIRKRWLIEKLLVLGPW